MTILTGLPRGPITSPAAHLVGRRSQESWPVDILDMDDEVTGTLERVEGGSVDFNVAAEIRASGSLSVADPQGIDWHAIRLRVRYEFVDEAGTRWSYPLGVFLPTTPGDDHEETGTTTEVELYDKTVILSGDQIDETWTAQKGTTVVQAVTDVLATIGEDDRVAAPADGGGTLAADMVWEPGTTKLRIVNDILEAGNFFSIWVDGTGVWQLRPYVPPAERGVEWNHVAGENAIFLPSVNHEEDTFNVPNRVVLVGRAEPDADGGDAPGPSAIAENNNPDDPFSIPRRGRVISVREDEQDATSESVLGELAARRLRELSAPTSTYFVQHMFVPVDLNGVVGLHWAQRGIENVRATLQEWSWSWTAGDPSEPVPSTLREVRQ